MYLTGLEPGGGKSTVALGVMELLSHRVRRLGAFRPLRRGGHPNDAPDPTLELLRDQYQLDQVGYGATYAEAGTLIAEGRLDQLVAQVVESFRTIDEQVDAVVVVGTDFGRDDGAPQESGGLPDELALNVRLANEMRAAVLAVVDGRGRDADDVAGAVRGAYHTLADLHATQVAVVANRVVPAIREKALATVGELPVPAYAIPDLPTLSAPTVAEVAEALGGRRLLGGPEAYARDVLGVVVGGAQVPTFLDYLRDGGLVITPGDRADLIVATNAAHVSGKAAPAGLLLTLGLEPDPRIVDLVQRLGSSLPVVSVDLDSYETVSRMTEMEGQLRADNVRKVQAALGAFESHVDGSQLAARLDITRSSRVTPMMFEYELISRARHVRRRVVLPEGTEERILRAAEIVLRRGVCELTLLGPEAEVTRRIRELGLSLTGVPIVDPATSPWREEFAEQYALLRAHRGMTIDAARDAVTDENYFGTMMVHTGHADAMVSGAVHPTADTIRPAFEIIKTVPGVSVASSVFFMCLPDRVLVYGDCAVNPDPDPHQLADIAISSAATAATFGIEPRVAMLSYSTGASGHGADVDKVAAATELVRSRRPDLLVDGPMQYDAAVDPGVAATKLPGSKVAGRATVFIFPDLNTGNNTYKAVQRSAGAIAVGPVLQGLGKPVNDLSRGATVPDIVNTIAITAVQAQ